MRLAVLAALLWLAGCSGSESPEERVRAVIASAGQAAENKDSRLLRSYVSDAYADVDGRDKRAVDGILRVLLLRHEAIHLLTRISEISLPEAGRATAVVYAAMAARPIAGPAQLASLRASLFRFDLELADENGDWRVVRAAWRRAEPADFIHRE